MSIAEYKNAIKTLVDATNDESLLKQWKEQLERESENQQETELTDNEWQQVQEGLNDLMNGKVLSLEDFLKKR